MPLPEDIPKKDKKTRRIEFTDIFVKNLKFGDNEIRYTDIRTPGLTLSVIPASIRKNGSKRWYYRYLFSGKANMLAFGEYPTVTLAEAREKAQQAKKDIAQGVDPSHKKKMARQDGQSDKSFQLVGQKWLAKRGEEWEASHTLRNRQRLENNIFKVLGEKDVNKLTLEDFAKAFEPITKRGALETAHRICAMCIEILKYSVLFGYLESTNIIFSLQEYKKTILSKPDKNNNLPTITDPYDVGELLHRIEASEGRQTYPVALALQLAPYVVLRPGELAGGMWEEINLEKAEWYIKAERMKPGFDHVVPLPRQAVELIKRLHAFSGNGKFMFPSSSRGRGEHITTAALVMAIRRMKYQSGDFTTHGFRAMASTILNGNKTHLITGFDLPSYNSALIEIQLSHVEKDKIKKAYDRRDPYVRIQERSRMLQTYADLLDFLKKQYREQNR